MGFLISKCIPVAIDVMKSLGIPTKLLHAISKTGVREALVNLLNTRNQVIESISAYMNGITLMGILRNFSMIFENNPVRSLD